MYPDLIKKAIAGDHLTVQVNEEFQYGENSDHNKRFLVFHDKNNRPYQARINPSVISFT